MSMIILDTETASLNGTLIELAWINPKTGESYEQRFNPDCKIDVGAMAVHHIIDADLFGKPLHTSAFIPAGVEYIVGHNVDYDIEVLKRSNVSTDRFKRICTLAVARKAFPELKTHTIGALMYHLSDSQSSARDMLKGAHSALADVQMTGFILEKIIQRLGISDQPQFLYIASEDARIPTHISFGKHKGSPLSALPNDYVKWLLGQPDIDPYLRKALVAAT